MKPGDVERSEGQPHDHCTRLANEVLEALAQHPEYDENVKAISFVTHNGRSGIGLHNYPDQKDAIVDLFVHMQALFASMGKRLDLVPMHTVNDPDLS